MMQQTLKALSEPNRLQIVELLIEKPRPVGEIVVRLKLSQPLVSKHLRKLREAGLVEVDYNAQQHVYRIRPKPLKEIDAWLQEFRSLWDDRFDRLNAYLKKQRGKQHGK